MLLGKCTWFEIPTSGKKNSLNFFQNVFKWKLKEIQHSTEQGRDKLWHIYTEEEYPIGALYSDEKKCGQDGIEVFLAVKEINEALAKTTENKGRIVVAKTNVPDGSGFYAKVRDPDGNLIGIWSN